jgi:hypothetical protein
MNRNRLLGVELANGAGVFKLSAESPTTICKSSFGTNRMAIAGAEVVLSGIRVKRLDNSALKKWNATVIEIQFAVSRSCAKIADLLRLIRGLRVCAKASNQAEATHQPGIQMLNS